MTLKDYEDLKKAQGGACAICGSKSPNRKGSRNFAVDHCHKSSEVRGLLCNNCNIGLGLFKDDVSVLAEAIKYLVKNP
jgi:hypothetical protein